MTPEQARELRHELRTPVNHLIGYAELLLEEDDASEADVEALGAVRARAREVLGLVPGLLGDGADAGDGAPVGSGAASIASLVDRVAQLESLTAALATTSLLPAADIERLSVAAARLGSLAARLADGPLLVQRDAGDAAARLLGRLETVLVVDDDEANRNVLGRRLAKLGYGIVEARDGVEALERLAQPDAGIDLVLLDVMMPRLDGFAVLERVRADQRSGTSR